MDGGAECRKWVYPVHGFLLCLHFLLIIRPLHLACYPTVVFQSSHKSSAVETPNHRVKPSLSLGVLSQYETLAVVTWLERGLGFIKLVF